MLVNRSPRKFNFWTLCVEGYKMEASFEFLWIKSGTLKYQSMYIQLIGQNRFLLPREQH